MVTSPDITLYFVRHGETAWNVARRYQGQVDQPMNDTGRSQARRNGAALRAALTSIDDLDFIASPLSRARETMEIIRAELGLPPKDYRADPRLMELSYGSWEGQLQADLPTFDPAGLAEREKDPFRWRPAGGESYAALLVRTRDWLNSLTRSAVVASHGGVSRCLRAHVLGLDPATIPNLESPQDKVLVLSQNHMHWL